MPDAEFFAVEQAILAAERQRGATLHASSAAKSGSHCLASSAHPLNRCSVDAKAFAGGSKKRKLPLSFAQQEKRPAPATTAALNYKVHCPCHLAKHHSDRPELLSICTTRSWTCCCSQTLQSFKCHCMLTGSDHLCIHSRGG